MPDTGLVQMTAIGPLPRVGDDGRRPVDVRQRSTARKNDRASVSSSPALVSRMRDRIGDQGLAGGVTLAFAPIQKLNEWIRLARAGGHEVLINIPMEPVNYPAYDPGLRPS